MQQKLWWTLNVRKISSMMQNDYWLVIFRSNVTKVAIGLRLELVCVYGEIVDAASLSHRISFGGFSVQ
jgi:hypothetical protein